MALTVAACGGEQHHENPAQPGEATPPGRAAQDDARTQEKAFLSAMVPHHQSAIDMAKAAEGKIESPELRRLQRAIERTQTAEIREMERIHRRLLRSPLRPDEQAPSQLGLSASEAGMDHGAHVAHIRGARAPVDRAFAAAMIPHHEGAVRMSEAVLETATDRELRDLAQGIIAAQRAEVRTLERIERDLGASAAGDGASAPAKAERTEELMAAVGRRAQRA